jgi:hypothetical protein
MLPEPTFYMILIRIWVLPVLPVDMLQMFSCGISTLYILVCRSHISEDVLEIVLLLLSQMYIGCWKSVISFKGFSIPSNEQNGPCQHTPRNQCLMRCERWYDLYSTCCTRSPCLLTQFQLFVAQKCALCRKFLLPLESPDRNSVLVPVTLLIYWSALNMPKFWLSQQPKIQKFALRGSCRPVDWISASYPLFTKSLLQVLSDNVEKIRCRPIRYKPYRLSLMKRHIFQKYWKIIYQKLKYTTSVDLLGNTTIYESCSKMPTQTMTRPYLSRHWFLDICGLRPSCSSEWVLYPFEACNIFNSFRIF